MSHSTVAIRVPSSLPIHGVQRYVENILRPYNEQGDADDDFMEFVDETENYRTEFETEGSDQIQLGNKFFFPWDAEVKDKGLPVIKRTFKEIYGTFEKFAKEYHGSKVNEDGGYGYWHNPNAKWDWWVIGGRWSGHWPVKAGASKTKLGKSGAFDNPPTPGGTDIIRIKDIDFERAEKETLQAIQKFKSQYSEYFKEGQEPKDSYPFSGPRSSGLDLGLVQCLNENEITDEMRKTCKFVKWERRIDPNLDRFDVIHPLPESPDFDKFIADQFNQLKTYARLDEGNGWVEPGRMGWWGMSSSTVESLKEYGQSFMDWLKSGNQEDWVVVVDVHI